MAYQHIFKRNEKKYLLNQQQYNDFKKVITKHMQIDDYKEVTVCNIYFDTPDYQLIRTSMEKPVYKEKLRLRTYGIPSDHSDAFIELKKKYKGIVYKRRLSLPYQKALDQLKLRKVTHTNQQISNEINYFFTCYDDLQPSMVLSYKRIAYEDMNNPTHRLTIDHTIKWHNDTNDISTEEKGDFLLKEGQYILELKMPKAMPLWLSSILDQLEIYPFSYSKYSNAYLAMLKKGAI